MWLRGNYMQMYLIFVCLKKAKLYLKDKKKKKKKEEFNNSFYNIQNENK